MKRIDVFRGLVEARQNVLPKRLTVPGPDMRQLNELMAMAAAAPDHRQLTPWRFVIVPAARRGDLGEAFAQALAERDPLATAEQFDTARSKAQRAPLVILAVVRLQADDTEVPDAERYVSLGAALQNVILGAQAMGFGAGLTSGQAMDSGPLRCLFALKATERAVCFLNIGTVVERRPPRPRPPVSTFVDLL